MGRKRVQLKKIERDDYRLICFGKRKDGLVKKAYELSTLCDVEVALIIFSAAGKLILFDGKRRVEETIRRYIDLPHHEFGRLPNEETIRGLINQMSLETKVYDQLNSSSDRNRRMVDTQLEIIQNQISLANVQLEEVEKQLQYFMTSPSSCMKSINEIECHETILKEAMKRVSLRKQVLEEKVNSEIASETLHPQTANAGSFMMGSPNYGLGWPQQQDQAQFLTTNLANPTGFQSLRNESENSAGLLPSSMAFHDATGYVVGNVVSGNSDQLQSSVVFRSAGYLAGNAGRTTGMTAGPSQVVSDAAEGSQGNSITPMIDLNLPFAV